MNCPSCVIVVTGMVVVCGQYSWPHVWSLELLMKHMYINVHKVHKIFGQHDVYFIKWQSSFCLPIPASSVCMVNYGAFIFNTEVYFYRAHKKNRLLWPILPNLWAFFNLSLGLLNSYWSVFMWIVFVSFEIYVKFTSYCISRLVLYLFAKMPNELGSIRT